MKQRNSLHLRRARTNAVVWPVIILALSLLGSCHLAGPSGNAPEHIPWAHELPAKQWKAWDSLRDEWMGANFSRCLRESGIKLSCGGCSNATVVVRIHIDGFGQIHAVVHAPFAETYEPKTEPTGRVCGERHNAGIERCFLAPLERMEGPEELRDLEFDAILGTGLSC